MRLQVQSPAGTSWEFSWDEALPSGDPSNVYYNCVPARAFLKPTGSKTAPVRSSEFGRGKSIQSPDCPEQRSTLQQNPVPEEFFSALSQTARGRAEAYLLATGRAGSARKLPIHLWQIGT